MILSTEDIGERLAGIMPGESGVENSWTWDLILKKAKEAGLKPEEVAKRLGLSE